MYKNILIIKRLKIILYMQVNKITLICVELLHLTLNILPSNDDTLSNLPKVVYLSSAAGSTDQHELHFYEYLFLTQSSFSGLFIISNFSLCFDLMFSSRRAAVFVTTLFFWLFGLPQSMKSSYQYLMGRAADRQFVLSSNFSETRPLSYRTQLNN